MQQEGSRLALSERVPLLYPLLRHDVAAVRHAAVDVIGVLARCGQPSDWALRETSSSHLHNVFLFVS